jgi:hypothetical protein
MKRKQSLLLLAALVFSSIACEDNNNVVADASVTDAFRGAPSGDARLAADAAVPDGGDASGAVDAAAGGDAAVAEAGDAMVDGPAAAPTFSQVYSTVIATRCMPCHTTSSGVGVTIGMLDMSSQATAYANLVNKPAAGAVCSGKGTRVVPGQPDMSIFYLKVSLDDPTPCGAKMPLGGELTAAEANLIHDWIMGQAQND